MPLPRWRFCMVPRTSRIASWRTPRGLLTVAARDVKPGYEPVFYDEHGLDQQRAYQIICFMVGSDPRGFRTIATQAKLPEERQKSCRGDYVRESRRMPLPHRSNIEPSALVGLRLGIERVRCT